MLKIELVDRWSDFLKLREAWNRLWDESPQRGIPFLAHEWVQAWWEAFGEGRDLLILLVRSGGTLIGIAPLMRFWSSYHGAPVPFLSLITNGHTNRSEFIIADRARECVGSILDFISNGPERWDAAELNFLPAESAMVDAIKSQTERYGLTYGEVPSYRSPYVPLQGNWHSFFRNLDGHFRRNLKNRERRLATLGPIEYEEFSGNQPSPPAFLEDMITVGERSWKGAEKTALGSTPTLRRFYTRVAELLSPRAMLCLHLLRVSGTPVAFHYSLMHDSKLYLLKTEYDAAYHAYSPGQQIQKRVLEWSYEHGLKEFEFLGPDMPWKRDWTDCVKSHVRLLLFHEGLKSRILSFLELQAKPVLKRAPLIRRLREIPEEV